MKVEIGDPHKKLNELQRYGASATKIWAFILQSTELQYYWKTHSIVGSIDLQMWAFLLYHHPKTLEIWERRYHKQGTSNSSWIDATLTFPLESDRRTVLNHFIEQKYAPEAVLYVFLLFLKDKSPSLSSEMNTHLLYLFDAILKENRNPFPYLLLCLQHEKNTNILLKCLEFLEFLGERAKNASQMVLPLLKHRNSNVRKKSLDFLEKSNYPLEEALPQFIKLLSDRNKYVRWSVTRNLEHMGDTAKEAIPMLFKRLRLERDPYIYNKIIKILVGLHCPREEILPILLKQRHSKNSHLQWNAQRILKQWTLASN
jgi:hypothetical protein